VLAITALNIAPVPRDVSVRSPVSSRVRDRNAAVRRRVFVLRFGSPRVQQSVDRTTGTPGTASPVDAWQLQTFGGIVREYVAAVRRANGVCFAVVLGLLAFLYVTTRYRS